MQSNFDSSLRIGMTSAVINRFGKLLVVNEILNELASWSEISFLSSFKYLVGILYGPVALLISSDERISLTSSLSDGKRKNGIWVFVCEVISVVLCNYFL